MEDPSRRKPWIFGINDSHINIVTHVSIINNDKIFQFNFFKHHAPLPKQNCLIKFW